MDCSIVTARFAAPQLYPIIAQTDLRDLTRHRTNFIREQVNLVNRIQKVLEGQHQASLCSFRCNGVTGRAILNAIAVETDPVNGTVSQR